MKESRILRYWEAFQKVSGVTGEHYLAEQFGYGKPVGDESAELIRPELSNQVQQPWRYLRMSFNCVEKFSC